MLTMRIVILYYNSYQPLFTLFLIILTLIGGGREGDG